MFAFALLGTGWRAMFYLRIAKALPLEFTVSSIYTRHAERCSLLASWGYPVCSDLDKALSYPHDAVVVASGPDKLEETLFRLAEKGERILTETSFARISAEARKRLAEIDGLVLEQYLYTPVFRSALSVVDKIGPVTQIRLSMVHEHHAASILRHFFPQYQQGYELLSSDFQDHIEKTGSRDGRVRTGEKQDYTRKMRILKGKDWLFINDFSSNQYHSYLIPSGFEIRGERGVITEKGITYVNEQHQVVSSDFVFHRDADKFSGFLALSHVSCGGEVLYENPFYPACLDSDELAIAFMLRLCSEGKLGYTIKDGIQDAELGKLL